MRMTPRQRRTKGFGASRQDGGLTIFTAVTVLVLMTLMLLYAARIGLFEQRTSANEARQKTAFHVAEATLDRSLEYLVANADRILSSSVDAFPDGAGGFTGDGWFALNRWDTCPANVSGGGPCKFLDTNDNDDLTDELGAGFQAWYYDGNGDDSWSSADFVPVPIGDLPANTTARVSLLMCFVDLGSGGPNSVCQSAPPSEDEEPETFMVLNALVYGYADCTDINNIATCQAEATVTRPFSNYKNLRGSPAVPLTSKTVFPPGGTAEVVPNPDGGGVGVPLSAWVNRNLACGGASLPIDGYGSWATCEMHEWYDRDDVPVGVECDQNTCSCTVDEAISYSQGQTTYAGIDIVPDDQFPCDLFEFYFGVPRTAYQIVKAGATIISNCNGLGPASSGLYWVSGGTCQINSNTKVGSPNNPVIIISAATTTRLNGGAEIFGLLYVFDGEDASAELVTAGTTTVYGAVVVDATMGNYNGTFQIVYNEGVLADASGINGIGGVSGGWRDFGLPDLAW